MQRAGWERVEVVEPGQPRADFGRSRQGVLSTSADRDATLRTWLVVARAA